MPPTCTTSEILEIFGRFPIYPIFVSKTFSNFTNNLLYSAAIIAANYMRGPLEFKFSYCTLYVNKAMCAYLTLEISRIAMCVGSVSV